MKGKITDTAVGSAGEKAEVKTEREAQASRLSLKALLMSRKKGFYSYIAGSLLPAFDNIAISGLLSIVIGLLQKKSSFSFGQVLVIALALIVIMPLIHIASRFLRIGYMRDILLDVRKLAFAKIMSLSRKAFMKRSKDAYVSNLVSDINLFEEDFFLSLLNVIVSIQTYGLTLLILFFLDWQFALVTLGVSALLLLLTRLFDKKAVKLKHAIADENERFSIEASNTLYGLEILKLNRVERQFRDKFQKRVKKLETVKQYFNIFSETQRVLLENIAFAFFIFSIFYVGMAMVNRGISLGQALFINMMSSQVLWNLVSLFPFLTRLRASHSMYERITGIEEEDLDSSAGGLGFAFEQSLVVRNLSFRWGDKQVLREANFTLEKGKKYLLKGPSGAGKSTLLNLLSRLYEDYSGDILLDGVDLRDMDLKDYNRHLAMIYQNVFLFQDSLRNNITLYQDYTDADLTAAIDQAGLRALVDSFPQGVDQLLDENGKNLSGGERQRISIARALIKDTELLFVDEATSGLDEELGRAVETAILNLKQTVLAISHRYYEGITERYDYVIEVLEGRVTVYEQAGYFQKMEPGI